MNFEFPKKILICDDDNNYRDRLAKSFSARGVEARCASSVNEAIKELEGFNADSAIIDLKMPGDSGLVLLKKIKESFRPIRVLILTGYGSIATAVEALKLGAHNYLTKPATVQSIVAALCTAEDSCKTELVVPSLEEVENEYIQRVLAENDGNISKSAKILGLHRRSLQRRISRY